MLTLPPFIFNIHYPLCLCIHLYPMLHCLFIYPTINWSRRPSSHQPLSLSLPMHYLLWLTCPACTPPTHYSFMFPKSRGDYFMGDSLGHTPSWCSVTRSEEGVDLNSPHKGNGQGTAHAFSLCSAPCSHANGDKPTVFGLLPPS